MTVELLIDMIPLYIRQNLADAGSSLDCVIVMKEFEVFAEPPYRNLDELVDGQNYEFSRDLLNERVRMVLFLYNPATRSNSLNFQAVKVSLGFRIL